MTAQQRRWCCLLLALLGVVAIPAMALTSLQCKIAAIKYEADQNNERDKKMVLSVITNRQRLLHKSACQIVLAKNQFSFVNKYTDWKYSEKQLQEYWKLVTMSPVVGRDVTHFHKVGVKPVWRLKMKRKGLVGKHYVYVNLKEK